MRVGWDGKRIEHLAISRGSGAVGRLVAGRNTPQKLVWRARIVLLAARGRRRRSRATGKTKGRSTAGAVVSSRAASRGSSGRQPSRPQAAFDGGDDRQGRGHDASRQAAGGDALGGAQVAKAVGLSHSSVQRIWTAHGLKPHLTRTFKLSNDPRLSRRSRMSSASIWTRRTRRWCCRSTRRAKSRRSTEPNPACR